MRKGGCEPTIPVFERATTVHALLGAVTLIGNEDLTEPIIKLRSESEGQDIGGWIILGWILERWDGLAQDRNRGRALVNSVLNLRVPLNAGKLSSGLSGSAQLHSYLVGWLVS
jgi:hypothetical protein